MAEAISDLKRCVKQYRDVDNEIRVLNKQVYEIWKQLFYLCCGEMLTTKKEHHHHINGITISPKKNFCIVKIWMSNCTFQNPDIITNKVTGLDSHGCLFKKHTPEY
jgi:hypothetical protein